MKKILCLSLLSLGTGSLFAETTTTETTQKKDEKSLWEAVTKMEKKTDKFNLLLNMHASFNANFTGSDFDQTAFKMNQLRIEAKGNVNNWLSYRWRQRLNRANDGSGMLDNLPTSIDIAGLGFRVAPNFSIFGGKQCTAYGGFEFDQNPIEIYEYSDMVDNMSNFMTGVNFAYNILPSQELAFQVLDARNNSFEKTYGKLPAGIEDTKAPLVYTLNWNGSFADGMVKTRWSASIMNEAKERQMYYYAFGTELNLNKVNTYFDVMYSKEGLDRKGIMTSLINKDLGDRTAYTALDAEYLSLVWKFNYRVSSKVNLFVKGMYETAGLSDNNELREKGNYRTSLGYLGGVEYYPMNSNLHFFVNYTGRSYMYSDRAKALGHENYNTSRISTGFIYQLPVF